MHIFNYDNEVSYEANFDTWYEINKREKFYNGEREYTQKEARVEFDRLYSSWYCRLTNSRPGIYDLIFKK